VTDGGALPGPSAQRWAGRARLALVLTSALVLAVLLAFGFGARPDGVLLAGLCLPVLAGLTAWLVLSRIATRRMLEERDAGYSTTIDAAGFDLRDGATGELLRARDVPPEAPGPVGSFLLRNMHIRQGTWVARRMEDDGDGRPDQRRE
jgi:hypothetical protein